MQPNEVLTPEERMTEIEECSLLLAMTVSGETPEEDKPQTQARLAYLFQRMQDRLAAREVAQKRQERELAYKYLREKYRLAHEQGRLVEYHCPESGEHAMFIEGEDDEAHQKWLGEHADAVLLKTDRSTTVTEDVEL